MAEAASEVDRLDEETRSLLRRIVEGLAFRELMLANIRGHGLKFVNELEARVKLAKDLDLSLFQFGEIERIYTKLGSRDVIAAVRSKTERIPYPTSRLELDLCLFLCEKTSRTALAAYLGGACRDLEALCRTRLESIPDLAEPQDSTFVEFCADASNRPLAQQMFNRWLAIALLAMGRPSSTGDARAVALSLRSRKVSEITREFLAELDAFRVRCHLVLPDAATLGVELPAPAASSRAR